MPTALTMPYRTNLGKRTTIPPDSVIYGIFPTGLTATSCEFANTAPIPKHRAVGAVMGLGPIKTRAPLPAAPQSELPTTPLAT